MFWLVCVCVCVCFLRVCCVGLKSIQARLDIISIIYVSVHSLAALYMFGIVRM